jgi:hypothetical protein
MYVLQQFCIFGFCPSSGIPKTGKHSISEIGSASILEQLLRLALCKGPNRIGVFPPQLPPHPHLKMETGPDSDTLCFLVFRILDDEQNPNLQ